MIKQLKFQRFLSMLNAGAAFAIIYFWWQFFNGSLFSVAELALLIPNFEAYYQWQKSFLMPDILLAVSLLVSALLLWFDVAMEQGRLLAASSAGAAFLLGVLELNYGFSSGLYTIDHPFADVSLNADLSITAAGLLGLGILFSSKTSVCE
jgi:hypothetical protein